VCLGERTEPTRILASPLRHERAMPRSSRLRGAAARQHGHGPGRVPDPPHRDAQTASCERLENAWSGFLHAPTAQYGPAPGRPLQNARRLSNSVESYRLPARRTPIRACADRLARPYGSHDRGPREIDGLQTRRRVQRARTGIAPRFRPRAERRRSAPAGVNAVVHVRGSALLGGLRSAGPGFDAELLHEDLRATST